MTTTMGLIMAGVFVTISNHVSTAILGGWYFYPSHITNEETEDQTC